MKCSGFWHRGWVFLVFIFVLWGFWVVVFFLSNLFSNWDASPGSGGP